MNTGIYYDPLFLRHETGLHPENPDRLKWVEEEFRRKGLWDRCLHPACRDATLEELSLVHEPAYVRRVREMAESGGGTLDPETVVSSMSSAMRMAEQTAKMTGRLPMAARIPGTFSSVIPPTVPDDQNLALCPLLNRGSSGCWATQLGARIARVARRWPGSRG